jgi:DMSO/TMAO reductase YedYZ molybdopterin-dependent catalytic subunit
MMRRQGGWGRNFWAGVAGGVVVALVLFAYRFATGMPTLQEALAERMIRLLPYQVFALILAKLQHQAKPLGLGMSILTTIIGFGLGGILYGRVARRVSWTPFGGGLATAAVAWLFLTFVFLPFIEGPALGAPLTTVVSSPLLPMALASLAYGLVLAAFSGRPDAPGPAEPRRPAAASGVAPVPPAPASGDRGPSQGVSRRDLLRRSALVVLAVAAGSRLGTWVQAAGTQIAAAAASAFRLLKGMPPEVTPAGQFYQVSKNFFDPTVDVAHWSLEVKGLVDTPLKMSLDELRNAAPAVERYQTFECISNEVGGDLISTAKWKGVRVKDILAMAGIRPPARTVIWHAADGYTESIPLAVAADPASVLAYEMNDEPIPQKHGAPVRVLLLNRYGMKQPKWLTGIEISDRDYKSTRGYWEQQGWDQEAIVKTNSAFRVETQEGDVLLLGGWAFAGDRGIAKVDVSPDEGKTWIPAAVKEPLGVNSWQFWSAEWTPPAPGDYTLKVRATDGQGHLQPEAPAPTLPDGAQGYHTVRVHIGKA